MKIPFGKHKGMELEEIISHHTGYFIWLTTKVHTFREPLKSEVYRLWALPNTLSEIEMYQDKIESYSYDMREFRNGYAMDNIDIED